MATKDKYELHKGDCLELMKDIPDASVDFICCDLPYGTTNIKWDIFACHIDDIHLSC